MRTRLSPATYTLSQAVNHQWVVFALPSQRKITGEQDYFPEKFGFHGTKKRASQFDSETS